MHPAEPALAALRHSRTHTVVLARAMPTDRWHFRPTPEMMSFGEVLQHLWYAPEWATESARDGVWRAFDDPLGDFAPSATDPAAVLDALDAQLPRIAATWRALSFDAVRRDVRATEDMPHTFPALDALATYAFHEAHHRGQLTMYMCIAGVFAPDTHDFAVWPEMVPDVASPGFVDRAIARFEGTRTLTIRTLAALAMDRWHFRLRAFMSVAEMAQHLWTGADWLTRSMEAGQFVDRERSYDAAPDVRNPASLLDALARQRDQFGARMRAIPVSQWTRALRDVDGRALDGPVGGILERHREHEAYHRGQLCVYLRCNGIMPPAYRP